MRDPAERPLWPATAPAAPPRPALRGPLEAEVAVVGAGVAGLSAALHLAERGVRTVVLEAMAVGAGASGRSGGHVLVGGRHSLGELRALFGAGAGERLHRFGLRAADDAFALIRRLRLACDAVRSGSLYAADSAAGLADAAAKLARLRAAGIAAESLDRDAIAAAIGSSAYLGGYRNPAAGSVQPLALVRELARAAEGFGATVHEGSPVLALDPHGAGWRARTPDGTVDARRVLVATNGRAGRAVPGLDRAVLPVWSFQVATDPLPASSGILPGHEVVSDTRRLLRYFRRDAEGRLLLGGKGTLRGPRGSASFDLQRRALARLFPQLPADAVRWWWGGEVSVTWQRAPRLVALGDGAAAHVACNGKGVAWNLAAGPVLADWLTGVPAEALPLPPPERLRAIPLHALRALWAAAGAAWLRTLDLRDLARTSP